METGRDIFGYFMGLLFCIVSIGMCAVAWAGLEASFDWRWALGGVVGCLLARLNVAIFVGLYFYASGMLGWPMIDSISFAVPGLMLITPGVAVAIFSFLVSTPVRR
jgi:hypothetical protein